MLIVFDTCTKPDYYRDVHKVLSAPTGTIVRYDYERRLWSDAAQRVVDNFTSLDKPIPTLLMYGQLKNYKKGDTDPDFMLTWDNAIFLPTRVAEVVNIGFDKRGSKERENIYVHLRVKGFLKPSAIEIEQLVRTLEQRKELPFGKASGYKWILKLPESIDHDALLVGTEENWSHVVDAFASQPSQFVGDVFWRVSSVRSLNRSGANAILNPVARDTNTFGSIDRWHIDFAVDDINRYVVEVHNYIPGAEDRELPPNAVILAKEDTSKLLLLPDKKVSLRRNATEHLKFGVAPIDFVHKEDAKLIIETEVGGHEGEYPPGSVVEMTLRIAKNRVRLAAAVIFALLGAVGAVAGATLIRQDTASGLGVLFGAIVCGYVAGWLYTNRIKILK